MRQCLRPRKRKQEIPGEWVIHDPSGMEIPRGWGGLIGRTIRGGIWIFSGTTHFTKKAGAALVRTRKPTNVVEQTRNLSTQSDPIYLMSSRDTKIKRTSLQSGLGLLTKEYEKNPSCGHEFWVLLTITSGGGHFMTYYTSSKYYGRTRMHDNIVP